MKKNFYILLFNLYRNNNIIFSVSTPLENFNNETPSEDYYDLIEKFQDQYEDAVCTL